MPSLEVGRRYVVVALVDGDLVAGFVFSCAAREGPAGPLPTTATFMPVLAKGGSGTTQPFEETALDDLVLDGLDRHRRLVDAKRARTFTRGRADAR